MKKSTINLRLSMLRVVFERLIEWDHPDTPARNPIVWTDLPKLDEPSPKSTTPSAPPAPDLIYGGNVAATLSGRGGDDELYGNNGADVLRGGPHVIGDYCNGGALNSGSGDTATACGTIVNVP